jgi:hypothetical protein
MEGEIWSFCKQVGGKELWMTALLVLECCGQERLGRSCSDSALGFVQDVARLLATAIVTGNLWLSRLLQCLSRGVSS